MMMMTVVMIMMRVVVVVVGLVVVAANTTLNLHFDVRRMTRGAILMTTDVRGLAI